MQAKLPDTIFDFSLFFLKKYKAAISFMISLTFLYSLDLVIRPYLLKMIIDLIASSNQYEFYLSQLQLLILYYITALVIVNIALRTRDYLELIIFPQLKSDIVLHVTSYIQSQSYEYFQNNSAGSLIDKIFSLDIGIEQIIKILINSFLSKILSIIIISILLSYINFLLTAIVLTWSIIFLTISIILTKHVKGLVKTFSKYRSYLITLTNDSIMNIMNVHLFARNEYEIRLIKEQADEMVAKDKGTQQFRIYVYILQTLLTIALICILIFLLLYLRKNNLVTVGDFALIISLSFSIADSIYALAADYVNFSGHIGSASESLSKITQQYSIINQENDVPLVYQEGKIEFRNVTFSYTQDRQLLDKQSLIIPGKQKVGLVGYSGSGKTTFVQLIGRLFDIESGEILIDGQNIQNITRDSLRKNISFIAQEKILFNRTVIENIKYGNLDASASEVIEAAKKASAHEFIMDLHNGYETIIGNNGCKLSGGQKQRIMIARALIKNAPILILDEATNSLDVLTEDLTQNNLKPIMNSKTVLVVSHKLSTLCFMDRILVFNNGRIIEDGTHNELMSQKGKYYDLIQKSKAALQLLDQ